ncbi:MAG: adenosine kinase [Bacteroidota bacterium]
MIYPISAFLNFIRQFALLAVLLSATFACKTKPPVTQHELSVPAFANREAYLATRQQYVQQDSAQAFDAEITLNEKEKRADQKLKAIQKEMLDHYKATNFFPPARYFYQSKEHIEQTDLYHLLRKMPKGGLLHLHPSASGDLHWVVDRALTEPACYVFWDENSGEHIKGQLAFFQENNVPKGFQKVTEMNQQVPHFTDSLHDLLTFDQRMSEDSVDIWGAFEGHFTQLGGFFYYQPIFRDYLTAVFDTLIADGVQHVELRAGISSKRLYDLDHPTGYYTADTMVQYYQDALERAQQTDPDFTLKLIKTNLRFRSLSTIQQDVIESFQLRQHYPDFIKAYDLVAEEDNGNSTLHFLDAWLMFDSLRQVYGVDLPLCLHDGESDWDLDNLYDAVTLRSVRIGHGFNLYRYPAVQRAMKEQDICMEINPLSNQILGYVRDLRVHPAVGYLAQGIQCSISSDDPAVFDYTGVTYDYWTIFLAWELDLRALKKLAMNSITYSLLNDNEKKAALQIWEHRWDDFIDECLKD